MLSAIYAAAARRRREHFAARPDLRRRLRRPVISVGNLAAGGRGKTPLVATLARVLLEAGERPAILSRGYARTDPQDGVVVVRDPDGIRSDLPRAGDEPLMLARQLPGTSVVVGADRYLAGRLAEHHLGSTVHILDDGFQHVQLDRDVDLVLVAKADVERPLTFPAGRLREPIDVLAAADAILTEDDVDLRVEGADVPVFRVRRTIGAPRCSPAGGPVFALAGTAHPERFFADLRQRGWSVAGTMAVRDHHPYSRRDFERVCSGARAAGAQAILTTEKDFVRLLPYRPFSTPVDWVPLTMEPDPLPEFREWLAGSLDAARDIIVD